MLNELSSTDRLRLMRFVCSFAWADLEVRERERAFIMRLSKRLKLDPNEVSAVEGWLMKPPRAEELDPAEVPPAHRKLLLAAVRGVVGADGDIDPEEAASLELLEDLLR
jgi:uncharacterized tellurite resistance protein B-like protein